MFEESLESAFTEIFGVSKVTYDLPGESNEQDCLFVEIETSNLTFSDGSASAMVRGSAVFFAVNEKIPFGFISKRISQARPALTKPFFFSDIETNTRTYRDIVQRGFSFTYFFDSQYDPDTGIINKLDVNTTES